MLNKKSRVEILRAVKLLTCFENIKIDRHLVPLE